MADFNKPVASDSYSNWPSLLKSRTEDIAKQFEDGLATNVPTGAKRWNDTNKNWEKWTGSWVALASQYAIDVATVGTRSAAYLMSRANHTGTQLSSTISDLQTAITGNSSVAANTAARHGHNNKTTLDAITAAYTTTEKTKLSGIETGATADQTKADIDALGINASTLAGIAASLYARTDQAKTFTAKQTFNAELALNGGISEDADTTSAGGSITLDVMAATCFYTPTLTSVPTFTMSNVPVSGRVSSVVLELNNAGSYNPVFNFTLHWSGGVVPEWSTGKDIITLFTRNGGSTWTGFLAGLDMQA